MERPCRSMERIFATGLSAVSLLFLAGCDGRPDAVRDALASTPNRHGAVMVLPGEITQGLRSVCYFTGGTPVKRSDVAGLSGVDDAALNALPADWSYGTSDQGALVFIASGDSYIISESSSQIGGIGSPNICVAANKVILVRSCAGNDIPGPCPVILQRSAP